MSRFTLQDCPQALPGCCRICGTASSQRGPYVDLGYSEEYHGAIYYCMECMTEVARIMGFATPSEVKERDDYIVMLQNDLMAYMDLDAQAQSIRKIFNDLVTLHNELTVNSIAPSSSSIPAPVSASAAKDVESGTGSANESSNESGLADVFSVGSTDATKAGKSAGSRSRTLADI